MKLPLIDIHTHILPDMDDGAKDIEQSLAMAQIAVNDGISKIVATPHVMRGVFNNTKSQILNAADEFKQLLDSKKIPLEIVPGAEYHLEPDLPLRLAAGELLTINNLGKYLLVELPANMVPDYTGRVLYELQLQGITPIIAHPERNIGFAREPELLRDLVARGILAQITSGSIIGIFGKSVKNIACKLLNDGLAQGIASDAHSSHGRSPVLSNAFLELERRWGMDYARSLTFDNPNLVIEGLPVVQNTPVKTKEHWYRFSKWLG